MTEVYPSSHVLDDALDELQRSVAAAGVGDDTLAALQAAVEEARLATSSAAAASSIERAEALLLVLDAECRPLSTFGSSVRGSAAAITVRTVISELPPLDRLITTDGADGAVGED